MRFSLATIATAALVFSASAAPHGGHGKDRNTTDTEDRGGKGIGRGRGRYPDGKFPSGAFGSRGSAAPTGFPDFNGKPPGPALTAAPTALPSGGPDLSTVSFELPSPPARFISIKRAKSDESSDESDSKDKSSDSKDKESSSDDNESSSGDKETSSGDEESSSGDKETSSGDKETSSGDKETSSGDKETSSGDEESSSGDKETGSGSGDSSSGSDDKDSSTGSGDESSSGSGDESSSGSGDESSSGSGSGSGDEESSSGSGSGSGSGDEESSSGSGGGSSGGSSNSTTPSTPSSGGGSSASGTFPTAAGESTLSAPMEVTDFDGGLVRFGRGVSCSSGEGGDSDAVFIVADGGSLSNVIIGADQIEGVHCAGACTITNVWWEAVCEDALSFKGNGDGTVTGGGAKGAKDKVVQHNGVGTISISGFHVEDFGKLYRSCGNCKTQGERHVKIDGVTAIGGSATLAGINSNFGDTMTLTNSCITGTDVICQEFEGTSPGNEPKEISSGPSAACIYTEADISAC